MPGRTVKAGDEGVRVFRVVVNSRAGCVRSSVGGCKSSTVCCRCGGAGQGNMDTQRGRLGGPIPCSGGSCWPSAALIQRRDKSWGHSGLFRKCTPSPDSVSRSARFGYPSRSACSSPSPWRRRKYKAARRPSTCVGLSGHMSISTGRSARRARWAVSWHLRRCRMTHMASDAPATLMSCRCRLACSGSDGSWGWLMSQKGFEGHARAV